MKDDALSNTANAILPRDWVPFTPGGTPLPGLAGESEASAWRNLIRQTEQEGKHYAHRSGLEDRGYTVKKQGNHA